MSFGLSRQKYGIVRHCRSEIDMLQPIRAAYRQQQVVAALRGAQVVEVHACLKFDGVAAERGVDDRVSAHAEAEAIGIQSLTADQRVVTRAAVQHVVALSAVERVVADAAIQAVVTGQPDEGVNSGN